MKISYKIEIENCSQCPFYQISFDDGEGYFCVVDEQEPDQLTEKYPCELRPCPLMKKGE